MPKPNVREKLVAAALDTIHRQGFNATGIQDIADAAGVPKGSVYNHFESKEALGAEIVERYWQIASARNCPVLQDQSVPPLDRLRIYFEHMERKLGDGAFAEGCLIGNLCAEMADRSEVMRERLQCAIGAWQSIISACLRDAQRSGDLAAGRDPDALATFLLSAWEGAVLLAKTGRDPAPLRQFRETVFTHLLR